MEMTKHIWLPVNSKAQNTPSLKRSFMACNGLRFSIQAFMANKLKAMNKLRQNKVVQRSAPIRRNINASGVNTKTPNMVISRPRWWEFNCLIYLVNQRHCFLSLLILASSFKLSNCRYRRFGIGKVPSMIKILYPHCYTVVLQHDWIVAVDGSP